MTRPPSPVTTEVAGVVVLSEKNAVLGNIVKAKVRLSEPMDLPEIGTVPVVRAEELLAMKVLSMRERMAQHRANPSCASCHAIMDPLGLSLENFDGIGA